MYILKVLPTIVSSSIRESYEGHINWLKTQEEIYSAKLIEIQDSWRRAGVCALELELIDPYAMVNSLRIGRAMEKLFSSYWFYTHGYTDREGYIVWAAYDALLDSFMSIEAISRVIDTEDKRNALK